MYRYVFRSLAMVMMISFFFAFVQVADMTLGADPEFSSYSITPEDPSFQDEINVSATFVLNDESITDVGLQICQGELCYIPQPMTDSGDGRTFFYLIPPGAFGSTSNVEYLYMHFFVTHTGGSFHYPDDLDSDEINVTIERKATKIEMTASPDRTTLFPNETVILTGKVVDDLGSNVSNAYVNLTVEDISVTNDTITDENGEFEVSVSMPQEGSFIVNVTVEKEEMKDSGEWQITVNAWPLPKMVLEGTISSGDGAGPSGETGYRFYTGSDISFGYNVSNIGTGTAFNVTALLNVTGEDMMEIDIGDMVPSPDQRFEETIFLNTSDIGVIDINITLEWDQIAPDELKMPYDPYDLSVEIISVPSLENHTVLVEMFTQTTCVPCVEVEEALERMYHLEDLDFELIMYVYDDQVSELRGNEMGVTSTPIVFVDHMYASKSGGGSVTNLEDELSTMISDASGRDTAPLSIDFEQEDDSLLVTLGLSDVFDEQVSGILQLYSIEKHSNMRNQQGIPIGNRYHGVIDGMEINDLNPGMQRTLTTDLPDDGFGYIASFFALDGNAVQTTSYFPEGNEREIYMEEGSKLIRIGSPAVIPVNLTLERFQFEDAFFDDIIYSLHAEGLPNNWTLEKEGILIDSDQTNMVFSYSDIESSVKGPGRVVYSDRLSLELSVPSDADGTYSFKVMVESSGYLYKHDILIIATSDKDHDKDLPPSITDIYLEGVEKKIYFHIEAENVPEGAMVKGTILPCNLGEGASCGIPKDFLLIEQTDGKYRASVTGVDLETFTHLTYKGWIELENEYLVVTEEKKVEIDTLIDLEDVSDIDSNGDGGIDPILLIILAILVMFILAMIIFILIKKSSPDEEQGKVEDVDKVTAPDEVRTGDSESVDEKVDESIEEGGDVMPPGEDDDSRLTESVPGEEPVDEITEVSPKEEDTEKIDTGMMGPNEEDGGEREISTPIAPP